MEDRADLVGVAFIQAIEIMLNHGFDGGTVITHGCISRVPLLGPCWRDLGRKRRGWQRLNRKRSGRTKDQRVSKGNLCRARHDELASVAKIVPISVRRGVAFAVP